MRKSIITSIFAASTLLIQACGEFSEMEYTDNAPYYNSIDYNGDMVQIPREFSAVMQADSAQSKTSYSEPSDRLITSWATGDIVCMSWCGSSDNAYPYQATLTDGNTATFSLMGDAPWWSNPGNWLYYYPGNQITCDIQYMNATYDGQVQSKANPYAHLAKYHYLRKMVENSQPQSKVDFSDAQRSACMKFILRGMTFNHPEKITLVYKENNVPENVFHNSNKLHSFYRDDNYTFNGYTQKSAISMGLTGYGNEVAIDAYMMMSNEDVKLQREGVARVFVKCADNTYAAEVKLTSDVTLKGGYCHTLTIIEGWEIDNRLDYKYPSYDGEVVTLQNGTSSLLNLVIMGDGFTDSDFQSGKYDETMREAYATFFSVEPYKSFKNLWNVYYVKTVSAEHIAAEPLMNGAINKDCFTRFATSFTVNSTTMSGDDELAIEMAKTALGANADNKIQNAMIIVMSNLKTHAGTCSMRFHGNNTDYGEGVSVAYCAMGHSEDDRLNTIIHEACGHGFGKLGDEYQLSGNTKITNTEMQELKDHHENGAYRNIDIYVDSDIPSSWGFPTTTMSNVYWSDMFNTSNNYEATEQLGVFKGANTYPFAFCRPTEVGSKSYMNSNAGQFNAPSRRAIFYRMRALSGQALGTYFDAREYAAFLAWDKNYIASRPLSKSGKSDMELPDGLLPLGEPVCTRGQWLNGHFIPQK